MVLWGQISVDKTKLEQIITWPNFTFGQLFMWIGANNGQIWLPMGYMSDSEQCSNRLELHLISLLVNFSCELGQIMTRYDFLWARWVILRNFLTDYVSSVFWLFSSAVPPGSGALKMPTHPSAASTLRGGRANLRNASVTFSLFWHRASLGWH